MSDAQHLIEGAIHCIESGKTYEEFANATHNKANSKSSGISLDDVWGMAMHVVYTFKSNWVGDTLAVLRGETPFDLDMREYVERFL